MAFAEQMKEKEVTLNRLGLSYYGGSQNNWVYQYDEKFGRENLILKPKSSVYLEIKRKTPGATSGFAFEVKATKVDYTHEYMKDGVWTSEKTEENLQELAGGPTWTVPAGALTAYIDALGIFGLMKDKPMAGVKLKAGLKLDITPGLSAEAQGFMSLADKFSKNGYDASLNIGIGKDYHIAVTGGEEGGVPRFGIELKKGLSR